MLAGLTTLALGLAACLSASAQAENPNQTRDQNRSGQGERKTIRGVIAGVTVEGELAIDARTNRAAAAEMDFLTVVGSERPQARTRDDDAARGRNRDDSKAARDRARDERDNRDRQASSERRRENVYIILLTPRTEIRNATNRRGDRDREEPNANRNDQDRSNRNNNQENPGANARRGANPDSLTLDALEVGDRVEIQFLQRSPSAENPNQNAAHRKHGRHRIYYGDAISITILAEPGQYNQDRDSSNRERNRDRDRDQNDRNNDREE
jgi:hypothetical protein